MTRFARRWASTFAAICSFLTTLLCLFDTTAAEVPRDDDLSNFTRCTARSLRLKLSGRDWGEPAKICCGMVITTKSWCNKRVTERSIRGTWRKKIIFTIFDIEFASWLGPRRNEQKSCKKSYQRCGRFLRLKFNRVRNFFRRTNRYVEARKIRRKFVECFVTMKKRENKRKIKVEEKIDGRQFDEKIFVRRLGNKIVFAGPSGVGLLICSFASVTREITSREGGKIGKIFAVRRRRRQQLAVLYRIIIFSSTQRAEEQATRSL